MRLFGLARLFGFNEEENLGNQNQRVNLYVNANRDDQDQLNPNLFQWVFDERAIDDLDFLA